MSGLLTPKSKRFVLWFDEISSKDVEIVGGKNANLGEMFNKLKHKGVPIPAGFAITSTAYQFLIKETGIESKIKDVLKDLDVHNIHNLQERGRKVRQLFLNIKLPIRIKDEIIRAYKKMYLRYNYEPNPDVAVRSSATAEDLPGASFAGQQETYLNIRGEKDLLEACKKCFASLFTDRAISYREDKGFDHLKVYLSIAVQKMIRSDLASSGVMFTIDTETGFPDIVLINAAYGLGENIVQGTVNPDEFYVHKPTLKKGFKPIITKSLKDKRWRMIYGEGSTTKNIKVSEKDQKKFCINDPEVLTLAKWACIIEDHYKKPMDIEWAKDGKSGKLYILQARPETVHALEKKTTYKQYVLKEKSKLIITGRAIGEKIGQGQVNIIESTKEISKFKKGEILVTEMTDPDWEPIMKIAGAIVTNKGGATCHAAIVSRELGVPCIVGTENATKVLKHGQKVTVSCTGGEVGEVYRGLLKFEVQEINLKKIPKTKTQILMNVGIPENAFAQGMIPSDGVGLAREEFIINSYVGIHPLALLNYKKINKKLRDKIDNLTSGYNNKPQFFVDKLAQGVGRIAAAFYPRPVIVRLSDFKSNEYANLIGGELYEPKEHNPMIGWRGASRYYDPKFGKAFDLECKALLKVRQEFGLKNMKIMVPFCRTVEEGEKVIRILAKNGLKRGKDGLEVYVMCEIPSNVILADKFCDVFDGFSIGSNDLTQLALGLDRDSELVASIYDERNEAVKRLIAQVIKTAKARKRKIGICGQAPSTFPEFAAFLVDCRIDSISLNPDTVIKTRLKIAEEEKRIK